MVNIINYNLSVKKSTTLPRFGTYSVDFENQKQIEKIWLDKRISKGVIRTLNQRGFKFEQEGWVDTGLGSLIVVKSNKLVEGSIAPV